MDILRAAFAGNIDLNFLFLRSLRVRGRWNLFNWFLRYQDVLAIVVVLAVVIVPPRAHTVEGSPVFRVSHLAAIENDVSIRKHTVSSCSGT